MKKILALTLTLILCMSMCACAGNSNESKQSGSTVKTTVEETQKSVVDEITSLLIGEWCYEKTELKNGWPQYTILEFNDEGYFNQIPVVAKSSGHQVGTILSGTYEVSENLIKATTLDSKGKALGGFECEVIYENGNLRVIYKGLGLECKKGDWLDYLEEHR